MAETPPKADAKPKTKTVPGLRVRALVNGFRRAGRAWSTTEQDVLVSAFSKEEIAALKAEPGLAVSDIDINVMGALGE